MVLAIPPSAGGLGCHHCGAGENRCLHSAAPEVEMSHHALVVGFPWQSLFWMNHQDPLMILIPPPERLSLFWMNHQDPSMI
jgi:hypothetical protein